MNYPKLKISGQEYSLCFKVGSIRVLKHEFGIELEDMLKELKSLGSIAMYLPQIIYAAMSCYCSIEQKEKTFTIDTVTSWFDGLETDSEELVPIFSLIMKSYIKPAKDASAEVKKENSEPFLVDEDRADMPRTNDDTSVGTGLVHVSRPVNEAAGV